MTQGELTMVLISSCTNQSGFLGDSVQYVSLIHSSCVTLSLVGAKKKSPEGC